MVCKIHDYVFNGYLFFDNLSNPMLRPGLVHEKKSYNTLWLTYKMARRPSVTFNLVFSPLCNHITCCLSSSLLLCSGLCSFSLLTDSLGLSLSSLAFYSPVPVLTPEPILAVSSRRSRRGRELRVQVIFSILHLSQGNS